MLPPYKWVVRGLWLEQHPTLVYYLNRDDSDLAAKIGHYYFNGGDYDLGRAAASYRLALALSPNMPLAHYQLARIDFVQGRLDDALREINAELALRPQYLRSLYVRGLIDINRHDLPSAEADFRGFVAWAPTEWAGYNDLAYVLGEELNSAESEQVVKQAFAAVPGATANAWLWNSLGLAQLNELHYTEAIKSFIQAQLLAQSMTVDDWSRAYPGNSPAAASASLDAFRQAIDANIAAAQKQSAF